MQSDPKSQWITPFIKQCFVVVGVSTYVAQYGLVLGFTAYLLPDLKKPGSGIPIDDATGSWIAAIPCIMILLVNFVLPSLMYRFGRKPILTFGVSGSVVTWLMVALATNVAALVVARSLQGLVIGVANVLCPMLVGEYTSPRSRGAFLTVLALFVAVGTFAAHLMGPFFTWQTTALALALVSFVNLIMVLFSPESPSFLISKGRYEEAKKAFLWLRGDGENEELKSMIEAHMSLSTQSAASQYEVKSFICFFRNLKRIYKRPEFYKPVIIVMHLFFVMQFTGIHVLASYAVDIVGRVVGNDGNVPMVIISCNVQRIITSICFVYINKKVRRKSILAFSVGLSVLALFAIAAYTYGVTADWFPNHATIGTLLLHLHFFSIGAGSMPMPVIIAGEIFPLQYRSFSSVLAVMSQAPVTFVTLKSLPLLFREIGLHWSYCLYAALTIYSVVLAWVFLPETKDRTLQDIEDEFRGNKAYADGVMDTLKGDAVDKNENRDC